MSGFPARSRIDDLISGHTKREVAERLLAAEQDIEMLRAVNERLVKDIDQARIDAASIGEMADQAETEVKRLRRALERIADDDCGPWDKAMRYARQVLLG